MKENKRKPTFTIFQKKEDTKSSCNSLSKLYDNSIVLTAGTPVLPIAIGTGCSTGVSLFVLRTQRNSSCCRQFFYTLYLAFSSIINFSISLSISTYILSLVMFCSASFSSNIFFDSGLMVYFNSNF